MSVQFAADPRNGYSGQSSCASNCCCEQVNIVPGESNRWTINYASWLAGLGGRGLVAPVAFDIVRLAPVEHPASVAQLPPTNVDYAFNATNSAVFSGNVSSGVVKPDGVTVTYSLVPGSAPKNGYLVFNQNGTFSYVANGGFFGVDSFDFMTSDGLNPPVVNRVVIGVSSTSKTVALTPPAQLLTVPYQRIFVSNPLLTFALVADDQLRVGDIYRMSIKQAALDCDTNYFYHTSCYDLSVVKC